MKDSLRFIILLQCTAGNEEISEARLNAMRAYKFLSNRSILLKLLTPTEDAFPRHVRRAALATLTDKTSHIPNPTPVSVSAYGWSLVDNKPGPVMSTQPTWPKKMKTQFPVDAT